VIDSRLGSNTFGLDFDPFLWNEFVVRVDLEIKHPKTLNKTTAVILATETVYSIFHQILL
jgi:hypothetical protein